MYTKKDYEEAEAIIRLLKDLKGAVKYDSDYCSQVLVPLGNGLLVRVCGAGEDGEPPLSSGIVRREPESVWGVDFLMNLSA